MVVGVHENRLSILLRRFSNGTYRSYISKLNSLISESEGELAYNIEVVKSHDLTSSIAFRMSFDFPVYIMLSHPICRFSRRRSYPVREGSFIASMGLVPVFFPTLNIMTVLLLYNERTEAFFSPINSPLTDTGMVCWELPPSSRAAEYSSMNFILQNGSDATVADRYLTEICKKYFNYGYWPKPNAGFVPSTHFLHSRERVTTIVKITKSLYIVDEIGNVQTFNIEGHPVECRQVLLRSLAEHNGEYYFKNVCALMDRELAEQTEREGRLQKGFINAIVSELQYTGGNRANTLNIIADYGDSYFELLQALMGIVATRMYYGGNSLSHVCTVDVLREKVFNAYVNIRRQLKLPATVSDQIAESFDIALQSLFPVLMVLDNNVYYTHPLLLGFLKMWDLLNPEREKQKEILQHLLHLLEKVPGGRYMDLYLSQDAEFFRERGIPKDKFTKGLKRVGEMIKFSNVMDRVWGKNITHVDG